MPLYEPQSFQGLAGGRLTTESGVPLSTSDRSAQSTLYYTPFPGSPGAGWIHLFDGAGWNPLPFTADVSLALSGLTSGKNYDVFGYDNAGTLGLEPSAAWTNDTTRADALATQDGVRVKNANKTRRLLGTIRTTGTTTTEDSEAKRFVWNEQNRVARPLAKPNTSTYTYNSSTIRQMQASSAHQVEFVVGDLGTCLTLKLASMIEINEGEWGHVGIGDNSTTAYATGSTQGTLRHFSVPAIGSRISVWAGYQFVPRVGYSFMAMLERAEAGTIQFVANTRLSGDHEC